LSWVLICLFLVCLLFCVCIWLFGGVCLRVCVCGWGGGLYFDSDLSVIWSCVCVCMCVCVYVCVCVCVVLYL